MQMCSRPFAAVKLTPFAGRVSELGESLARPTPDSEKYDTMTPSSLLHQNQQTDRQTDKSPQGRDTLFRAQRELLLLAGSAFYGSGLLATSGGLRLS